MASPGPVDRLAALRSMVTREGLSSKTLTCSTLRKVIPRGGRWKTPFAPTFTPPIRVTPNPVQRSRSRPDRHDGHRACPRCGRCRRRHWRHRVDGSGARTFRCVVAGSPEAEELLAGAPRPEGPARAVLEVARDPRVDQLLRPNERDPTSFATSSSSRPAMQYVRQTLWRRSTLVPRPPSPVVGITRRTRAFVSRP